jgi:hypothetical protein
MSIGQDRAKASKGVAVACAFGALLGACSTTIWMPGGPFTQAQLISGLEAHGYRDVTLGNEIATPGTPRPELLSGVRSADDPGARKTPVHLGWNGMAMEGGQVVNIYVRAEAPASLPRDVASLRRGQEITIYLDRIAERTVQERTAGTYLEPGSAPASVPAVSATNRSDDLSMRPRGTAGTETISSDIALRLAEMVFEHSYGREVTEAQLPLLISDGGDRWEIHGRKAASAAPDPSDPAGGRLGITIMKADARIVELVR